MATLIVLVVLGILSQSVTALIVRATAIANAMLASKATFPSPTPAIAVVLADIAALTAAEAAFKSHTGTLADREDKRKLVIADLHQLHSYVQQLASANPAQAEQIASDAAMTLKKHGQKKPNHLTVKQTVSGSVKVLAKAAKGEHAHEWQYSTDGGKTWISVPATTQAHVTILGLQPGVLTHFRQRPLTKAGFGDWSDTVSTMVS